MKNCYVCQKSVEDDAIYCTYCGTKLVQDKKEEKKVEVEIPLLEEGDYVLVAYIATANEDIRVTKPVAIEGNVVTANISQNGLFNNLYSENNQIKIKSNKDSTINISLSGSYTYNELYDALESYAYNLGTTTGADIEKLEGSNWNKVNDNDSISNGTYRLRYLNKNVDAYVVAIIS